MGLTFLSPYITTVLLGAVLTYLAEGPYRPVSTKPPIVSKQTKVSSSRATSVVVATTGLVEAIRVSPLLVTKHSWVRQVFFTDGDYVRGRQILLKFLEVSPSSSEFSRDYLLAPHSGFLTKRNVAVGHRVRAGTCVATLQDVSQVKVPLVVSAQVGRAVRVCDPVVVRVAEMPGRTFAGIAERIDRQLLPQPKTVVLVSVRNAVAPLIKPQMHALVSWQVRLANSSVAKR